MSAFTEDSAAPSPASRYAKGNALSALVAAGLMLFYGFLVLDWHYGISGDHVFDLSGGVAFYTLRIGGILMLISAVLSFAGLVVALAYDAVVSSLTGVLLTGCGAIWLVKGDQINGILFVVFGIMFIRAGWINWLHWRGRGTWPAVPQRAGFPVVGDELQSSQPAGDPGEKLREFLDRRRSEPPVSGQVAPAAAAAAEPEPPAAQPQTPSAPPEGFLKKLGRDEPK